MTKKPSIPRRNKVNWHYVRDDILFLTIKVVPRHQNTQQYGTLLPIELTNDEIGNTKAYKEYYACATGEATPKPKASARKKRSGSDTSITPSTAITTPTTTVVAAPRLTDAAKGKQPAKAKSPTDPSEVARTEAKLLKIVLRRSRQESHISQLDGSSTDKGTEEEESFDPIPKTLKDGEDDGNGEEDQGSRVSEEQRLIEEEEEDELYQDQESSSMSSHFVSSMLNPTSGASMESIFATSSSPIAPFQTPTPIMTPSTIATITTISHAPIPPTPIPSKVLQNLPTFDSVFHFDERLKSLEANFSKDRQTNPFVEAVSNISGIVQQYMTQQMNKEVRCLELNSLISFVKDLICCRC
nr:hypothetical protein [Tanacetum cinerariifolium]